MNKKITAVVIAAFLVLIMLLSAIFIKSSGSEQYNVVFFGDSRVGNDHTETSLPYKFSISSGLSVFNAGIGGSTLAKSSDDTMSCYSMAGLSEAVALKDFGVLTASIPTEYIENNEILAYMPDTIENFKNIDFKKTDYFIVEQGTNDYLAGIPLTDPNDRYDVSTFGGALYTTIEHLKSAAPNAKIIVVSPCLTCTLEGYSDEYDLSFGTIEAYVELERKICSETGVSFVDYYHESGINRDNLWDYLYDGLHPNDAGNDIMIDLIKKKLN